MTAAVVSLLIGIVGAIGAFSKGLIDQDGHVKLLRAGLEGGGVAESQ